MGFALACTAVLALSGCASAPQNPNENTDIRGAYAQEAPQNGRFKQPEVVTAISTHLGVTSESAASAVQRLFKERGEPTAYITGEERGGAFTVGARYGEGTLWMKDGTSQKVYWQGPSIGFDIGADASKVFTLVYGLQNPDFIYRRFPGAEGSAYLVAGMAVNYQRANGVTLAPVRTGVGGRLGAHVGYTSYTRKRSLIPL